VTKLAKPTAENCKELHRRTREIVQKMIDLGVNISIDTWPPTKEQLDEEYRLRSENYLKEWESKTGGTIEDDVPDLPF
jgi:hypothetical protein